MICFSTLTFAISADLLKEWRNGRGGIVAFDYGIARLRPDPREVSVNGVLKPRLSVEALSDAAQRATPPAASARLMHAYARRKVPRKAVHCLLQLMLSGQRPTRAVFHGMLAAYAAVGKPEVAVATLQRMQNDQ